jgi:hypothetical protein
MIGGLSSILPHGRSIAGLELAILTEMRGSLWLLHVLGRGFSLQVKVRCNRGHFSSQIVSIVGSGLGSNLAIERGFLRCLA